MSTAALFKVSAPDVCTSKAEISSRETPGFQPAVPQSQNISSSSDPLSQGWSWEWSRRFCFFVFCSRRDSRRINKPPRPDWANPPIRWCEWSSPAALLLQPPVLPYKSSSVLTQDKASPVQEKRLQFGNSLIRVRQPVSRAGLTGLVVLQLRDRWSRQVTDGLMPQIKQTVPSLCLKVKQRNMPRNVRRYILVSHNCFKTL